MSSISEEPLVDVLLPVFNGAETVKEAVASLLAQTTRDVRILAIDDGSSDATPRLLREMAACDPRVCVLSKPNSGIVDSLNLGLRHVHAPFVARQDADDISFHDRFAKQIFYLKTHPDVVAVSGSCIHIDKDGTETGSDYKTWDPNLADDSSLPSVEPYLLHPFLMMHRDALVAVRGYRHVFNAEDTDLYWRLNEHGRLANMSDTLGKMRLHDSSISNASILNGRIMAVNSQLAAISARRRRMRQADIEFTKHMIGLYKAADSLDAIVEIAGRNLDEDERAYLRAATGVKLLELATGRAYELQKADCRFVRNVYVNFTRDQLRGRCVANWAYRATIERLFRKGLLRELSALANPLTVARTYFYRFL